MKLKKLYIFVEGNDDELFFKKVIIPVLLEFYDDVEIIQFAQMKKTKIDLFILSINTLKFDYILLADLDYHKTVGNKMKYLMIRFSNLKKQKIIVVIQEIESWYIAGLKNNVSREFGIVPYKNTDKLVKEEFNTLYRHIFKSRIDFQLEILKNYSIETAKDKNHSFNYFYNKYLKK